MGQREQHYPVAAWAAALAGDLGSAGMTGDMIVEQEAAGTRAVVTGELLPRQGSARPDEAALLARLGFVLGESADDLFVRAAFPAGWTKEASREDSRTTILRDERGQARGFIWYKAAFYDRDAYMVLNPRFRVEEWPGDSTTARDWESRTRRMVVVDGGAHVVWSGTPYQRPGRGDDYTAYEATQVAARAAAEAWLDATWPEWRDKAAYWGTTDRASY